MLTISETGIYPDIPEDIYHGDPVEGGSISSTEAKLILQAPAVLKHYRENPRESSAAFDFGSAVHSLITGVGGEPVVYPSDVLSASGAASTKAARQWAADARKVGKIPVTGATYEAVNAAADSAREHPLASLIWAAGDPEVSVFAKDPDTGVWMRGRIDWVMPSSDGVRTLVDIKTTADADPSVFARMAAKFGYDIQRAWYLSAWELATGERARFLHVVVSKQAPFLVSVCEMNWAFDDLGRTKVHKALRLYRECIDSGEWPGIPAEVYQIIPPAYYLDSDGEE